MFLQRGAKRGNSRFSLLLLSEGEYYLEDHLAFRDHGDGFETPGRLRVCSHSLVFEPEDQQLPLSQYKFESVTEIKMVKGETKEEGCEDRMADTAAKVQSRPPSTSESEIGDADDEAAQIELPEPELEEPEPEPDAGEDEEGNDAEGGGRLGKRGGKLSGMSKKGLGGMGKGMGSLSAKAKGKGMGGLKNARKAATQAQAGAAQARDKAREQARGKAAQAREQGRKGLSAVGSVGDKLADKTPLGSVTEKKEGGSSDGGSGIGGLGGFGGIGAGFSGMTSKLTEGVTALSQNVTSLASDLTDNVTSLASNLTDNVSERFRDTRPTVAFTIICASEVQMKQGGRDLPYVVTKEPSQSTFTLKAASRLDALCQQLVRVVLFSRI